MISKERCEEEEKKRMRDCQRVSIIMITETRITDLFSIVEERERSDIVLIVFLSESIALCSAYVSRV